MEVSDVELVLDRAQLDWLDRMAQENVRDGRSGTPGPLGATWLTPSRRPHPPPPAAPAARPAEPTGPLGPQPRSGRSVGLRAVGGQQPRLWHRPFQDARPAQPQRDVHHQVLSTHAQILCTAGSLARVRCPAHVFPTPSRFFFFGCVCRQLLFFWPGVEVTPMSPRIPTVLMFFQRCSCIRGRTLWRRGDSSRDWIAGSVGAVHSTLAVGRSRPLACWFQSRGGAARSATGAEAVAVTMQHLP